MEEITHLRGNNSRIVEEKPLSILQKRALLQMLLNAYDQLTVVSNLTTLKQIQEADDETTYKAPQSLAERIKAFAYQKIYDELDRAVHHSTQFDVEAKKIENERLSIINFYKSFINELRKTNGTSYENTLFNTLESVRSVSAEETQLINETNENLKIVEQLKNDLYLQSVNDQTIINDLDRTVRSAIDIQRTLETENVVKTNYVAKWNKSRVYQHSLKGFMTLSKKVQETEKAQDQIQNEVIIHKNILKFEELFMQDLNKKLKDTIEIYNKQTAEKDREIADVIEKTRLQSNEMTKLKAEYDRKLNKINDWLEAKAEMKRKAELEESRRLAVTRIQSWWRMCMVRKCLGPFKMMAKNKKKGKSKK